MNWIKAQWAILKKYGFAFSVCLQTGFAIWFFVRAFMSDDYYKGVCFGCFGVMFIMMSLLDFVVARMRNEVDKCKEALADTKDKLCLAEHEAANLRVELDIYKAAQKESAAMKPDSETPQTANAETMVAPKPKPYKRKPAPKRKPKTENPDENKN